MENDYSKEVCKEDRLPMFYRTIKLPDGLWDKVKECGNQEKKALRWIVDEALDAELLPLVESPKDFCGVCARCQFGAVIGIRFIEMGN